MPRKPKSPPPALPAIPPELLEQFGIGQYRRGHQRHLGGVQECADRASFAR